MEGIRVDLTSHCITANIREAGRKGARLHVLFRELFAELGLPEVSRSQVQLAECRAVKLFYHAWFRRR